MRAHPWPGNVRELENVLQAAYVLGDGPVLQLEELSPELRGEGHEVYSGHAPAPAVTLEDRERQLLLDAWEAHGGRRGEMAEALGMSRSTLYRKLRAHGLS
jgi:transcriptional regulator of acetoin/glycerol metabolism